MPHQDKLPRITALDSSTLARAHAVSVHSPDTSSGGDDLRWTLTVTDASGTPLGRDHLTAPDWPTPLGDIVAPHLDLAGLQIIGDWCTDLGDDDLPRHVTRIHPTP